MVNKFGSYCKSFSRKSKFCHCSRKQTEYRPISRHFHKFYTTGVMPPPSLPPTVTPEHRASERRLSSQSPSGFVSLDGESPLRRLVGDRLGRLHRLRQRFLKAMATDFFASFWPIIYLSNSFTISDGFKSLMVATLSVE